MQHKYKSFTAKKCPHYLHKDPADPLDKEKHKQALTS
jgi:hypothetical protein